MPSQSFYYGHVQGTDYRALFVHGVRTIDEAPELDGDAMQPAKDRDNTRSGDVARAAYQIKVVERGTYTDFEKEVYDNHAAWADDQKDLDRQISRAWDLIRHSSDSLGRKRKFLPLRAGEARNLRQEGCRGRLNR